MKSIFKRILMKFNSILFEVFLNGNHGQKVISDGFTKHLAFTYV